MLKVHFFGQWYFFVVFNPLWHLVIVVFWLLYLDQGISVVLGAEKAEKKHRVKSWIIW